MDVRLIRCGSVTIYSRMSTSWLIYIGVMDDVDRGVCIKSDDIMDDEVREIVVFGRSSI